MIIISGLCNVALGASIGYIWYSGHPAQALGILTFLLLDRLDRK